MMELRFFIFLYSPPPARQTITFASESEQTQQLVGGRGGGEKGGLGRMRESWGEGGGGEGGAKVFGREE